VCAQGAAVVAAKRDKLRLERGSAAWVSADDGRIRLAADQPATLFRVTVGI